LTDTVTIHVGNPPLVSGGAAETSHPVLTIGDALVLGGSPTAASGTPPYTYHWSLPVNPAGAGAFDDPTIANPAFHSSGSGEFLVRVEVTDAGGCTASTQSSISVAPSGPTSTVPIGSVDPTASSCGTCGTGAGPLGTLVVGVLLMTSRFRRRRRHG
jgi:hypothetical protein